MFDINTLHPSHLPMRAAASLARASDCLKEAQSHTESAMRDLAATYGLSVDVTTIGAFAALLDEVRGEVLRIEADEPDLDERLRRARAL